MDINVNIGRHRAIAIAVLSVAFAAAITLAGTRLISTAGANEIPTQAVQSAALRALGGEYAAMRADNELQLDSLFAGRALAVMQASRTHVRDALANGGDYPGDLQLSNVRVLDMYGTGTAVTADIQVHGKLPNMKAGQVVDYSESDGLYHVVLTLDGGTWKIIDLSFSYPPGAGP